MPSVLRDLGSISDLDFPMLYALVECDSALIKIFHVGILEKVKTICVLTKRRVLQIPIEQIGFFFARTNDV
jgi:hypothetical protein